MADLSVTAANVKPGTGAIFVSGVAGATITAGQPVYRDSATDKFLVATASGTQAQAKVVGIALNGASDDQLLDVQTGGVIKPGATVTKALVYILSGTAGGISPHTDTTTPATTEYCTVIGVGDANDNLVLGITHGPDALA